MGQHLSHEERVSDYLALAIDQGLGGGRALDPKDFPGYLPGILGGVVTGQLTPPGLPPVSADPILDGFR